MRWLSLGTALGLLVLIVGATRAQLRGETHLSSRLAAGIVLLLAAVTAIRFVVDPDRPSGYVLVIMTIAIAIIAIAAARGRFRAPSR